MSSSCVASYIEMREISRKANLPKQLGGGIKRNQKRRGKGEKWEYGVCGKEERLSQGDEEGRGCEL